MLSTSARVMNVSKLMELFGGGGAVSMLGNGGCWCCCRCCVFWPQFVFSSMTAWSQEMSQLKIAVGAW